MYSTSVSGPTASPTFAKAVLTELVSASRIEIEDCEKSPELASGTPLKVCGEVPSTVSSGPKASESSAAEAVTTFIVEPGG